MTNREYKNRHKRDMERIRDLELKCSTYKGILESVRQLTGAARDEPTLDAVKRSLANPTHSER